MELGQLAAMSDANKVAIAEDSIASLVALLRDGAPAAKGWAAMTLAVIAQKHLDTRVAVAQAGGIARLVALLRDGTQ